MVINISLIVIIIHSVGMAKTGNALQESIDALNWEKYSSNTLMLPTALRVMVDYYTKRIEES